MGKRKKRKQILHFHLHATPHEQSPGFTRRAFRLGRRAFLTVLGNVVGGWVFEQLFHNAPVPKVVTIEPPTIGPTAQPFPPSVAYEGMVPLRIAVTSTVVFSDSVQGRSSSPIVLLVTAPFPRIS
jgi:hypothetical protein